MNQIYLDSAATTRVHDEVVEEMKKYFTESYFNPSSLYGKARTVKDEIDMAREYVAASINAESSEIYFTSGGSESNCWAIQGFMKNRFMNDKVPYIITTEIEHKSILECVKQYKGNVQYCSVDNEGFVILNDLDMKLEYLTKSGVSGSNILVSIQFANNEIGTIQNVRRIADIVHRYGAVFHTDAVQAYGQDYIDVELLKIDMMSVSGHKIHAPKGIGFLYKRETVEISPLIYGSQERGLRGGTENVPYIIGFCKAIKILENRFASKKSLMTLWRDSFISELEALGCTVNGSKKFRLPNNINVTFNRNIVGENLIYMLSMSNIYISAGSACNSKSHTPSHVLKAIGMTDENAMRTIRITLPDVEYADFKDIRESFFIELKRVLKLLEV